MNLVDQIAADERVSSEIAQWAVNNRLVVKAVLTALLADPSDEMRNAIAKAVWPCLERAHNEHQLADAALSALAQYAGVK